MELNHYINGNWYTSVNGQERNITNPANGKIIAHTVDGTTDDVKTAIRVARSAFDQGDWAELCSTERSKLLIEVAIRIEKHLDTIAELEMLDNGKPLHEAKIDVQDAADCFRYYASIIRTATGQTYNTAPALETVVVREPVGVCGLIVPWNFPLLMSVWKIAAALAAGNTIVLKPSEITPITAVKLFEIFDDIGLPDGVVNLVMGDGKIVGNELAVSHDIDMISFTGGTDTGRHIMKAATGNLKKVSLELGGKSPNIIFADTDIDMAVDYALYGIYYGAGQICSAASRILVEDSIYGAFVERFVIRANNITVGAGDNPNTEMGPLVSEEHMQKVLAYIQTGKEEGARIACGGNRLTNMELENGYFVEPTAFIDVKQHMRIVQEEIFGPVVTIQKFTNESEAIEFANNTKYGLAGSVFTKDYNKAWRVIKK